MRTTLMAAGLFAAALTCAGAVQAQTQAPAAPAADQSAAPASASAAGGYSDDELKAFGAAMTEVSKVNGEYAPRMASADGPTKDTLQKEMIGKMGAAVSASGLTPAKYNEISGAVQKDPALRERLTTLLNPAPAA